MNNLLPFSGSLFFGFIAVSTLILWICKLYFSSLVSYKWVVTFISSCYLIFLYPKPIHILALIIFLYALYRLLLRFYKSENLVFPMVLLSIPLFFMKSLGVLDGDFSTMKGIFQIAGISYITFKTISLFIDERVNKQVSFFNYYTYISFVPTILIGPIDRYNRFAGDIEKGYQSLSEAKLLNGFDLLIKGLLYKFIIAEFIHSFILEELMMDNSFGYHLVYMYGYLFFLFFDFAGYSLLAVGFGNLLGIDVPMNFDKPFLAKNPKEFWKKWHITLGDWLGDYFFKPLFKYFTKKKTFGRIERQNVALFLTFLLMGFWNGFELHFILSGALFGLYSVIHNYYEYQCKKNKKDVVFGNLNKSLVNFISVFIMINGVAIAIYIFSGKII
ncbi:MAG: MBOAT family O-acyltransferase [Flavobacteriales bacterium]